MRTIRLLSIMCLLVTSTGLYAQTGGDETFIITRDSIDSGKAYIIVGGVKIDMGRSARSAEAKPRPRKNYSYVYSLALSLGVNNFTAPDYSGYPDTERNFLDPSSKSLSVGLTMIGVGTKLNGRKDRQMRASLDMKWDNFIFRGYTLEKGNDGMIHPAPISPSYKKSKLTNVSLHIPLTYRMEFNNLFRVEFGVYGALLINSFTKYKSPRHKTYGGFGVTPVQTGLTASVDLRGVSLYGNYSLTPFFKNGMGPRTQVYTIGVKIF